MLIYHFIGFKHQVKYVQHVQWRADVSAVHLLYVEFFLHLQGDAALKFAPSF